MNLAATEFEAINTMTLQTDYRSLCDSLLASIELITSPSCDDARSLRSSRPYLLAGAGA